MAGPILIDKTLFLQAEFVSAVVNWNRLEGRPRREDFARSLKAEVRDPLWALCRQWQFGEFHGENTGSAIAARLQMRVGKLDAYAPADDVARPYDDNVPLEVRVEREPIPMALGLRVQIGRHFSRLIGLLWSDATVKTSYLNRYPIVASTDPERAAQLASDTDARAYFSAVEGRLPDGRTLLDDIGTGAHETFVTGLSISESDRTALRNAALALTAWFARLYSVPTANERVPWQPSRLEYRFACGSPVENGEGRVALAANQYPGGDLDWHAFDVDRTIVIAGAPGDPLPQTTSVNQDPLSFLPTPIEYGGMPNMRYWQFEDSKTSFGDIRASTTDLALLMLAEFGLIYGNDWILVPYELGVGSYAAVLGVVVTDVFGVRTFVRPAGSRPIDSWQHWNLFNLRDASSTLIDPRLLLLPVIGSRQEGAPIERVTFTRDEMANMVFAIEETIPGEIGTGVGGDEAAAALTRYLRANEPPDGPAPIDTDARIRYVAGTTVPENWIPFLPVQVSAVSGDIRLQRGRMARIIRGAPSPTVAPRGDILRVGLDQTPQQPYVIEEEEVPAGGTKVVRAYQRTRWYDGRVYVWIGRQKTRGRGDSDSGLQFDQVQPLTKSTA
ncbi:MAG TPA: hypothetical protein VGF24_30090 [Vicinamibacterales bacterium]|jgi:hypothetical protein